VKVYTDACVSYDGLEDEICEYINEQTIDLETFSLGKTIAVMFNENDQIRDCIREKICASFHLYTKVLRGLAAITNSHMNVAVSIIDKFHQNYSDDLHTLSDYESMQLLLDGNNRKVLLEIPNLLTDSPYLSETAQRYAPYDIYQYLKTVCKYDTFVSIELRVNCDHITHIKLEPLLAFLSEHESELEEFKRPKS